MQVPRRFALLRRNAAPKQSGARECPARHQCALGALACVARFGSACLVCIAAGERPVRERSDPGRDDARSRFVTCWSATPATGTVARGDVPRRLCRPQPLVRLEIRSPIRRGSGHPAPRRHTHHAVRWPERGEGPLSSFRSGHAQRIRLRGLRPGSDESMVTVSASARSLAAASKAAGMESADVTSKGNS